MDLLEHIITGVVLIGVTVAAVYLITASRRYEGQHNRSGDALWSELGRAHGLSAF